MEIWKPIQGYEGMYEVSNLGKVRSFDRIIPRLKNGVLHDCRFNGGIVKITDNGHGYKIVSLSKMGRKNHYVHRLVAIHFIPNPDKKGFVNHKDGCKCNNEVKNLEWVTHSENIIHSLNRGGHPSGRKVKNSIQVKDMTSGKVFDTIRAASKHYNISYSCLKQALKRKRKPGYTHKNPFYDRFLEIPEENPKEAKELGLSIMRLDK